MARTCPRCRTIVDSGRYLYCPACKARLRKKRPRPHMKALEQPYEAFVAAGGGVDKCGICGGVGKTKRLHRDHDHRTGTPRGILCFPCNAALRPYMTAGWLRAALAYVERSSQ